MKKTNIALLASITLLLSSCAGSGKIKDIVDFTPRLTSEGSGYPISLAQPQAAQSWTEGAGWINTQPQNFAANIGNGKFVSHKVAKGRMIAAPVIADGKIFTLSESGIVTATQVTPSSETESKKAVSTPGKLLSNLDFGNRGNRTAYSTLWTADLKNSATNSYFSGGGMAYNRGILLLTHGTRDMVAFDAIAGKELWRRRLPDVARTQPVIYQNAAIVQTLNNQTYAVDLTNGRVLWQHDGLPETLSTGRNIAPIIHNGKVIVGYSSGQLIAINLANGQEIWQINLSREGDILPSYTPVALESQPIVEGDALYVASGNGFVLKVNMDSGGVYWQNKVRDVQGLGKSGNALFVTNNAKQVAALATDSGKVIWATDLDPVLEGKKPTHRKPAQLLTPVVINGELIVASSDGKLRLLSPQTGEILKEYGIDKGAQYITVGTDLNIFTGTNVLNPR